MTQWQITRSNEPGLLFSGHSGPIVNRELFYLDEHVVFLNHGSFGACPREVLACHHEWQRRIERQPVLFLGRQMREHLAVVRQSLAEYVSTRPENIVCIPNATTGVNIIARSLELRPGDEILSTDHEYGACERAWRMICRDCGASFRSIHIPLPVTCCENIVDRLAAAITDRTRAVFFSHCTSATAIVFPVDALVRMCRDKGVLSIVDGAHGPGQLAIDLSGEHPDFYIGNCHKWLMAPKGSAFLYAAPAVQRLLKPLVISWGNNSGDLFFDSFIEELSWQGTSDPSAYLSIPAAIDFQRRHHWSSVREACHELVRAAEPFITGLTGLPSVTPLEDGWFCQMRAYLLPEGCDLTLQQELYDRFSIEIPVTRWNDRFLLRMAIQGYNAASDIERLIDALSGLLPQYSAAERR